MKIRINHNPLYSRIISHIRIEIHSEDLLQSSMNEKENIISARFYSTIDMCEHKLPSQNIYVKDILGISRHMQPDNVYDCILEISSFIIAKPQTNCSCSIRGIYRSSVPSKYKSQYHQFFDQSCIEVGKEFFLISPYNNLLTKTSDGTVVEIIPQSNYNLYYVSSVFN